MTEHCCDDFLSAVDPAARRLGVAGFAALWRGRRPLVVELGADPATVDALVRAGRLEVDADGRLVGVHGLVARPTPHRIQRPAGTVHTWCALDAIGIPAALGIDATAITRCPTCSAELRTAFQGGKPTETGELRLWLPEGRCTHLVNDFCAHTNLYCTSDHLAASIPPGTPGRALSLDEAVTLGRSAWSDVASSLRPDEAERR